MAMPIVLAVILVALLPSSCSGPPPPLPLHDTLLSYHGKTPTVDGRISPGEYDDAFSFSAPFNGGAMAWTAEFAPVTDPKDLSVHGWIKHDDKALFLAFNITDDVLYSLQTPHWTPKLNPLANVLNRTGWPWFGDEMEVLLNAAGPPAVMCPNASSKPPPRGVVGNETEWQMVMNLQKSRLGGVGVGGLMEGEPRSSLSAWNSYQSWIKSGKMKGAANVSLLREGSNTWVAEWEIDFSLMQIEPGKPYDSTMPDTAMGALPIHRSHCSHSRLVAACRQQLPRGGPSPRSEHRSRRRRPPIRWRSRVWHSA